MEVVVSHFRGVIKAGVHGGVIYDISNTSPAKALRIEYERIIGDGGAIYPWKFVDIEFKYSPSFLVVW